jgi:hypothetical protein
MCEVGSSVLDLLGLLTGVRDWVAAAPVRRGKPDRLAVWRDVLGDRSADAFPRQLAVRLRAAKAQVSPIREVLWASRLGGLYPAEAATVAAATATEYVLVVAAGVLDRLADGLPRAPTRDWMADDEVADLGRQVEPLLTGLPTDLAAQVEVELAAVGRG